VDTSLLAQELEPLNAQIEETRAKIEVLEDDLRLVEAELDSFSDDKQRYDTLREICDGLDKLGALGAGEMFWSGVADPGAVAGHLEQMREQVTRFEQEFQVVERRRQGLREQAERCREALDYLFEEVHDAYAREERRLEEFAIVREISPVAHGPGIMPWAHVGESERRFRKILMISLLWTLLFGILIPWINVPIPDRVATVVEIPERLATLVKKEPPKPEPVRRRKPELAKADTAKSDAKLEKSASAAKPKGGTKVAKGDGRPAGGGGGGGGSPGGRKARTTGVLAFKASFADMMDEVPVARLGTEARLKKNSKQAAGQAVAHRSLVASQAKSGGSGGISNFGVSRNLGSGGSGGGSGYGRGGGHGSGNGTGWGDGSGVGYGGTGSKVKSAVAGLSEQAGRPLSDGPGPGRTDEEIQIVFDRYKATLYRIYNRKLREDPTLRGKLLLRLTIEPGGEVSMCEAESTDLASPELVAQIVARVKRFNFGPKEGVPPTTILYPIDFLPAG
jgi:uncharacterized coiled-coil protein SlyX